METGVESGDLKGNSVVKGPALPAGVTFQHNREIKTHQCLDDLQGHTLKYATQPTHSRRAKNSGLGGPLFCGRTQDLTTWVVKLLSDEQ